MAFNPFIGWSQADLEAELEAAQIDLIQGKSTSGAGDGTVMVKSQINLQPMERIRLILRALNAIAPSSYPAADVFPITTTRVVFS